MVPLCTIRSPEAGAVRATSPADTSSENSLSKVICRPAFWAAACACSWLSPSRAGVAVYWPAKTHHSPVQTSSAARMPAVTAGQRRRGRDGSAGFSTGPS